MNHDHPFFINHWGVVVTPHLSLTAPGAAPSHLAQQRAGAAGRFPHGGDGCGFRHPKTRCDIFRVEKKCEK